MTDVTPELIANWHKEIEEFLARTSEREMFTATEIQDFLLDLRNLSSGDVAAECGNPTEEVGNPAAASSGTESTVY